MIARFFVCSALCITSITSQVPLSIAPLQVGRGHLPAAAFGLAAIRDIELRADQGDVAVFLVGRRNPGQRFELVAGRIDPSTFAFTPSNAFAQLDPAGDVLAVTVSTDLLHVIFETSNGLRLASRPSPNVPFLAPGRPVNLQTGGGLIDPQLSGANRLLFFRDGLDLRVASIDLSAAAPVRGASALVDSSSAGAEIAATANSAEMEVLGARGSIKIYVTKTVYKKNGTVKYVRVCIEGSVSTGVTGVGDAGQDGVYSSSSASDTTAACQLGGSILSVGPQSGIDIRHVLDVVSFHTPSSGRSVDLRIQTPVAGFPGGAPIDQVFLFLGTTLPAPVELPVWSGALGIQPFFVFGSASPELGDTTFRLTIPNGLPNGLRLDFQPVGVASSSASILVGGTGALTID